MPDETKLVWPETDAVSDSKSGLNWRNVLLVTGSVLVLFALIFLIRSEFGGAFKVVGLGILSGIGIALGKFLWDRLLRPITIRIFFK